MGAMGRNLAVLALVAGAVASNPDETSFQRYVEWRLQHPPGEGANDEGNSWLEAKIMAYMAKHAIERKNYYVMSVVTLPSELALLAGASGAQSPVPPASQDRLVYVGMFGQWFRWPFGCKH